MKLPFGISRWKPRHLLAAWSAYWAGLVLVTLGPAALAILRVTMPEGGKGSVSAGFDNSMFNLVVKAGDATIWQGSAQASSIALWIAGPPLMLYLAWLWSRPSRLHTWESDAPSARMLGDGPVSYDREKAKAEPERVDRN